MSQAIAYPITSRTYVALAIARGIAAANGHADLTGCHVALGILREGENPAVAALHRAGVSLRQLRRDLEAALPKPGHVRFGEVTLPATPGEHEIVEGAFAEAVSRDNEFVGNQHLLLVLLRQPDSAAGQIFARHRVTYETAADHLRAILSGDGWPGVIAKPNDTSAAD